MKGTVLYGERDIRFEDRPEPTITKPTDAILRLSATCICGSDSVAVSRHSSDCSTDADGSRVLRHRGRSW